jgi:hypothetical protein
MIKSIFKIQNLIRILNTRFLSTNTTISNKEKIEKKTSVKKQPVYKDRVYVWGYAGTGALGRDHINFLILILAQILIFKINKSLR